MSGELVHTRRVRDLDVLVLDSPHNRNAMSIRLLDELLDGVAASAAGDGRGLLLEHTGPVFCAGVDLRERRTLGPGDHTHTALLARLLAQLWSYPKPVLCRIDGPVRGGGMGLVACADIAVASSTANFAYSEVRVGVAPVLVAAVAAAKVPLGPLLPWLLTGESFDAHTAHRLGLVTRVADPAEGSAPDAEITALLQSGPHAVQAMKRLARRLQATDLDAALTELQSLSAALFASPEAQEGMAAFSQRRAPSWRRS